MTEQTLSMVHIVPKRVSGEQGNYGGTSRAWSAL